MDGLVAEFDPQSLLLVYMKGWPAIETTVAPMYKSPACQ